MRKAPTAALAALLLAAGVTTAAASEHNEGVCDALDSGKVDVETPTATVTVNAPPGLLVSGYCVKAGSIRQGYGPEYVDLAAPLERVTFGHSSGKDISHWSASFVSAPVVEPDPEPEPEPEPLPELPPAPPAEGPTEHLAPPVPPVVHIQDAPGGVGSPAWREANPDARVDFG